MCSLALAFIDSYTRIFADLRKGISWVVNPVYVVAEIPYGLVRGINGFLAPRVNLINENKDLRGRNLKLQQMVIHYQSLEEENRRMRSLLSISDNLPFQTRFAEVVGVVPGFPSRVLINKGSEEGLAIGQAVVGSNSILGQIVEVNAFSSRVLLVTDSDSAIPVRVQRSKFRSILGGTGDTGLMVLENVPTSAEIFVGDLIETSGLGGSFPSGYSVGKVISFKLEETSPYAMVSVEPLLELNAIQDLLVVLN